MWDLSLVLLGYQYVIQSLCARLDAAGSSPGEKHCRVEIHGSTSKEADTTYTVEPNVPRYSGMSYIMKYTSVWSTIALMTTRTSMILVINVCVLGKLSEFSVIRALN